MLDKTDQCHPLLNECQLPVYTHVYLTIHEKVDKVLVDTDNRVFLQLPSIYSGLPDLSEKLDQLRSDKCCVHKTNKTHMCLNDTK